MYVLDALEQIFALHFMESFSGTNELPVFLAGLLSQLPLSKIRAIDE